MVRGSLRDTTKFMDAVRKRLLFRAHHMGTNENDIFFGAFADEKISLLNNVQLDRFENLLKVSDPDLFLWVTGAKPVPADHDHDVMAMLRAFTLAQAHR
jgi:antitoxin CptB